jgi:hypothetical protein
MCLIHVTTYSKPSSVSAVGMHVLNRLPSCLNWVIESTSLPHTSESAAIVIGATSSFTTFFPLFLQRSVDLFQCNFTICFHISPMAYLTIVFTKTPSHSSVLLKQACKSTSARSRDRSLGASSVSRDLREFDSNAQVHCDDLTG